MAKYPAYRSYTAAVLDKLLSGKQGILKDGDTIKTINNESILGEGNIDISLTTLGFKPDSKTDKQTTPVGYDPVTGKLYVEIPTQEPPFEQAFTADDLTDGFITFTHNFNSQKIISVVYDNNGTMITPNNITIKDVNNLTIDMNNLPTIVGSYRVVIISQNSGSFNVTSGISDAPSDDTQYLRKNGIWVNPDIAVDDLNNSGITYLNLVNYDDLSDWELDGYIDGGGNISQSPPGFVQSNMMSVVPGEPLFFYNIIDNKFSPYTITQLTISSFTLDKTFINARYPDQSKVTRTYEFNTTATTYFVSAPVSSQKFTDKSLFISTDPDLTGKDVIGELSLRFSANELIKYAKYLYKLENMTPTTNQWNNLSWYAYGTSLTSITQGKYTTPLSELSGLALTNKGIPGGGITDLGAYSTGQVKAAVMNTIDGKLDADLITLEVGANDSVSTVELVGTEYDNDDTTYAGCLNQCIRYLQMNTTSQIVIISSCATTTDPLSPEGLIYDKIRQMTELCAKVNRVYYIDANNGMGWGRIGQDSNKLYISDNIHNTDLGGKIWAESIWAQLKDIPTWSIE